MLPFGGVHAHPSGRALTEGIQIQNVTQLGQAQITIVIFRNFRKFRKFRNFRNFRRFFYRFWRCVVRYISPLHLTVTVSPPPFPFPVPFAPSPLPSLPTTPLLRVHAWL